MFTKSKMFSIGVLVLVVQCLGGDIKWVVQDSLPKSSLSGYYFFYAIAKGNGNYVLVSGNGDVFTSEDCIRWTLQKSYKDQGYYSVTYQNGTFVACGDKGVIYSSDGKNWSFVDSVDTGRVDEGLVGIASGKDVFVSVGNKAKIFFSTDGKKWQRVASELEKVHQGRFLDWVIFENNMFVAVGDIAAKDSQCLIVTSQDGINWTRQKVEFKKSLWRVIYGKGKYIASATNLWGERDKSDSTTLIYSTDAINWKKVPGVYEYFNDINFTGEYFIGIGNNGKFYISYDGISWSNSVISGFESKYFYFVYYKKPEKPEEKGLILTIAHNGIPIIAYEEPTTVKFQKSIISSLSASSCLYRVYSLSGRKIFSDIGMENMTNNSKIARGVVVVHSKDRKLTYNTLTFSK